MLENLQSRRVSRQSHSRLAIRALLAAASAVVVSSQVLGVTQTWDGGGVGGTDLGTAVNWSNDTLPSPSTPDVALFNGSVAGDLSLIYSNTAFAGVSGNTGLTISMASTQTGNLLIDWGANTASMRLGGGGTAVTVAAGAGSFTLGDGVGASTITLGGGGNTTQAFINNSSNLATISSDVVCNTGGGGNHTISFGGSGNWLVNNTLINSSGNIQVFKTGTGVATLAANSTYTGATTVTGGTLYLTGNGTTASLFVTTAAGDQAVLRQTSGSLSLNTNVMVGNALASTTSYAFYEMSGGTINQTGVNRFRIGQSPGLGTAAIMNLSGGNITTTLGIALNDTAGATAGSGGNAVLNVTSGSVTSTATVAGFGIGGRKGQSEATIGGTGIVTLSGPTVLGGSIASTPAAGDAGRVAVLNVGNGSSGGLLQTTSVSQDATAGAAPVGYLNFNGGTLKARTTNANFINGITQATISAGGGTIDNNGVAITIPQALSDPTGNGVMSIAVSGASGYKGAPYVQITGGGATVPATAVANVDASGNVTGITITNPGSGYTSDPTIALIGGGGTAGTLTPTTGAATPGALNLVGAGTTTFSGNVTRTGATNINAGAMAAQTGFSSSSPTTVNSGGIYQVTRAAATGSFNQTGTLTLASGAALKLDLGAFGLPTDPVLNTGALISDGAGTINIAANNLSVGSITLIDYTTRSGSGTFTLGAVGRIIGSLVDTGSALTLNITGFNPNTKWKGNAGSAWDLDTTANWVFATDNSSTTFKQADVITFDDTASSFSVDLAAVELQPGSINFNNSSNDYTLAGAGSIGGSTGLAKNGSRTVILANTGTNTFSGPIAIHAGTLQIGNGGTGGSLGTGTQLTNDSVMVLNVVPAAGVVNVPQAISGAGSIIIQGSGATLSGNNTYDGVTQISAGTVLPTQNTSFGSTVGATTVENGAQIYATSANLDFGTEAFNLSNGQLHTGGNKTITFGGNITMAGNSTFNADGGSTGSITGNVNAAGAVVNKAGNGNFVVLGTTTASDVSVTGGLLVLGGDATYNNATLSGGALQIGNGGTTGSFPAGFADNLSGIVVNRSDAVTVPAGKIIGAGPFTQNGVGTTTLQGDNSFLSGEVRSWNGYLIIEDGSMATGTLTADGGSVLIKSKNALGSVSTVYIAADNAQTGGIELTNGYTDLFNGNTINFSARQPTNLTPGLIALDNNNSVAGNVVLQSGGSEYIIQVNAGATLEMKGTLQCAATITTSGRNVRLQGAGVGTYSGVISTGGGTGTQTVNINKLDAGVWTLNAANTYTGTTTASSGTLVLVGSAKAPVLDSGRFGISNGGALVLDYNDTGTSPGSTILADFATNEATGFLSGKIRTTLAIDNSNAIGWNEDTTAKTFTTRYTRKGDINLDGLVDSTDFSAFAANYGKTSGAVWAEGNFDYNDGGKVNTGDFNYLAGNFGQTALAGALPGDLPAAGLGSVVPEPGCLGVLGVGMLGLIRRRRQS
jgi:autotransporter-associated beta strand protein